MYGITTKNITNANGIQILKGEKVQCLFITELGNNKNYNTILIRVMEVIK